MSTAVTDRALPGIPTSTITYEASLQKLRRTSNREDRAILLDQMAAEATGLTRSAKDLSWAATAALLNQMAAAHRGTPGIFADWDDDDYDHDAWQDLALATTGAEFRAAYLALLAGLDTIGDRGNDRDGDDKNFSTERNKLTWRFDGETVTAMREQGRRPWDLALGRLGEVAVLCAAGMDYRN